MFDVTPQLIHYLNFTEIIKYVGGKYIGALYEAILLIN